VSHLGDRVAALVDGQLPIEATERAHCHLAHCRECRDAVELERLMKVRLSCLAGPQPDGDLVSRLLAMGGPCGPLPPREGHVPGSPRPLQVPAGRPADSRPAGRALAGPVGPGQGGPGRVAPRVSTATDLRRRRARLAGAVLGALGVVGAGVGGLVIAGPAARAPGPGSATLDSFVRQATAVRPVNTGRLPFAEQSTGWQVESVLTNTVPILRAGDSLGGR
jgi:hypothetical protein